MAKRKAVIFIDVEQQKARQGVSELSSEFVRLERVSEDAVSGVERHARGAAGAVQRLADRSGAAASNVNLLAQRSNQTSQQLRSFHGRSARANNLLFEMAA